MRLFNYDSRVSAFLSRFVDICLVNLLFVLTCIPVITYGGARTALFMCAVRWLKGEDADVRFFLKSFRGNLKSSFVPGLAELLLAALLIPDWLFSLSERGSWVFVLISSIVTLIVLMLNEQIFLYNARLVSSGMDLIRNGLIMTLIHPWRALLCTIPAAVPVVLFIFFTATFIKIAPLLPFFYYSLAALFTAFVMDRPYRRIIEEHSSTEQDNLNIKE